MGLFKRQALGILDRIYQFTGAVKSTSVLDLQAPVQLVHDTSREAELAGYGLERGWAVIPVDITHPGAGSETGLIDLYGTLVAFGAFEPQFREDEVDLWIFRIGASLSGTAYGELNLGFAPFNLSPDTTGAHTLFPLWRAQVVEIFNNYSDAAQRALIVDPADTIVNHDVSLFPLYMPHSESRITYRGTSTGAITVYLRFLVYVCPRGGTPPGMR